MVPLDKLSAIVERFEYLEARMGEGLSGDEFAQVGREYAQLKPVVDQIAGYRQLLDDITEAEAMLDEFAGREDLQEFLDDLVNSGIAGTRVDFPFYWFTLGWLVDRWPDAVHIDWRECTARQRRARSAC